VQANPPSNPQLIATTLTVADANGLLPSPPVYPPGKAYKSIATGDSAVMTYDGKFSIKLPVKIGTAKPGKYELTGEVRYQACNDQTCFFPIKEQVTIPVVVK
jgi:hypothetical protein